MSVTLSRADQSEHGARLRVRRKKKQSLLSTALRLGQAGEKHQPAGSRAW